MEDPVEALVFYVVFLFSTTLHEASHAWAAKRGGDLTAYHGGQVSIDTGARGGCRVTIGLEGTSG